MGTVSIIICAATVALKNVTKSQPNICVKVLRAARRRLWRLGGQEYIWSHIRRLRRWRILVWDKMRQQRVLIWITSRRVKAARTWPTITSTETGDGRHDTISCPLNSHLWAWETPSFLNAGKPRNCHLRVEKAAIHLLLSTIGWRSLRNYCDLVWKQSVFQNYHRIVRQIYIYETLKII